MTLDYLRTINGRLYYGRRFPTELVAYIPAKKGRGEGREFFKKSLRAKTINDPGAMDRLRAAQTEFDEICEKAKRAATRTYDHLTDELIGFLADTYRRDLLADDDNMRWKRPMGPASYVTRGSPEEVYEECRSMLEDYDTEGLVAYWREWSCSFASATGYVIDPNGPRIAELAHALAEAACDVWLAIDQRIDGKSPRTPPKPNKPVRSSEARTKSSLPHVTLQMIADDLEENNVGGAGYSTLQARGTALRFFRDVHGEPSVYDIDRLMVTTWLDALSQKPAKVPKSELHLPLPKLIARYEGDEDVTRLSKKTLRGHLATLATIWKRGHSRGHITGERANPFQAREELAGGGSDAGPEFSMDELQSIFDLPVFVERDRPAQGRGEAAFWMPLILLTTGVRPEEAAQLLVSDFEFDDEAGEWWLRITDEVSHPVKGIRTLKTKSARRGFVVPELLINLGLIDYVNHLKSEGQLALFPLLTVKNKKRGYLYSSVAEWWGPYIREGGVVLEGLGRRPYRDFRTTWATAARNSGLTEDVMGYLMGHSIKSGPQTRRYGQRDALGKRMAEVLYPKLDFSKVLPWQP